MLEGPGDSWKDMMAAWNPLKPKERWPVCEGTPSSMGEREGTGLRCPRSAGGVVQVGI